MCNSEEYEFALCQCLQSLQNSAAWPEEQRLNRFGGSIQDSDSLRWGVMEEKTGGEMKGIPCP